MARTQRGEIAMNVHSTDFTQEPDRQQAEAALAVLRKWAEAASVVEVHDLDPALAKWAFEKGGDYPALARQYQARFVADADYKATLPDLQNGPSSLIRGARTRIEQVGISNFRMPLPYATRDGGSLTLETSITGSVSLEAEKKGINMSRIMRSFYAQADAGGAVDFAMLDALLDRYRRDLESFDARLQLRTSWPMLKSSLRSDLVGYQYYTVGFEAVEREGQRAHMLHLDYVYSSTCPCSLELSEHARETRGQLATPHSQRSVARISVRLDPSAPALLVEDLVDLCRQAVVTETQVMVKREDEQAFAELNAANPIFVEDAARLFCQALAADPRISDFRVIASHQESLHSHDAIAVLTEGPTFAMDSIDPQLLPSLIHQG